MQKGYDPRGPPPGHPYWRTRQPKPRVNMHVVVKETDGNVDAMLSALEEGATVDDTGNDSDDETGLTEAAKQGNSTAVAWLLDNGASVNHMCNYSGSALHIAITAGKTEVAKLLIDRGINVNLVHIAPTGPNRTALGTAEARGNEEIATLLRNKGAINDKDSWRH